MRFSVTTTGIFYTAEEAERLKALGFTFERRKSSVHNGRDFMRREQGVEIEFTSLDELMAFVTQWGEVVLSDGSIEIYDDYRE